MQFMQGDEFADHQTIDFLDLQFSEITYLINYD